MFAEIAPALVLTANAIEVVHLRAARLVDSSHTLRPYFASRDGATSLPATNRSM
jgi:hypothetical protein